MKIIPWSKPSLDNKDRQFLNKAFNTTWISGGEYVRKLQNNFKKIQKENMHLQHQVVQRQYILRIYP
jgi:dTDP-4-amino-4,6-dideoxygalactose transaminase